MKESILAEKSFDFAIRINYLYKYLIENKKEFVMSKQLLRSGTAIGTMQSEGTYAESKTDFIHKYGIAQKESNKTFYWLKLIHKTDYIDYKQFDSLLNNAVELMKIINASILTTKKLITNRQSLITNR